MRREKRTARIVGYIPASRLEELELVVSESNVMTISDYLLELVERDLEEKRAEAEKSIRISQQILAGRAGKQ